MSLEAAIITYTWYAAATLDIQIEQTLSFGTQRYNNKMVMSLLHDDSFIELEFVVNIFVCNSCSLCSFNT